MDPNLGSREVEECGSLKGGGWNNTAELPFAFLEMQVKVVDCPLARLGESNKERKMKDGCHLKGLNYFSGRMQWALVLLICLYLRCWCWYWYYFCFRHFLICKCPYLPRTKSKLSIEPKPSGSSD